MESTKDSVELKPDLKKEVEKERKTELTNFTIIEIDSLFDNGILTKKFYPNMSACGGGLYGFYYNDELKLIDSKYRAELGFSSKKIYWNGDEILKIKYREYFAEWGKYKKKYPKDEWDESKMTYSDTIYQITLGDKYDFKKMVNQKVISTKIDSTLVKKLIDCGKRMKIELESELHNDYSKPAELFAKEVLKENLRKHSFHTSDLNKPEHTEIFDNVGLKNIIAYSNKNYPKNSDPNSYEHFTLFVANYHSELNALKTFALITATSNENPAEYQLAQKEFVQRIKALNIGAKPGGIIVQSGKQIFSLVKTCRETPIGGTWSDYEKKFIKYLTKRGDGEFKVLSSNCGMNKYELKTIKASW